MYHLPAQPWERFVAAHVPCRNDDVVIIYLDEFWGVRSKMHNFPVGREQSCVSLTSAAMENVLWRHMCLVGVTMSLYLFWMTFGGFLSKMQKFPRPRKKFLPTGLTKRHHNRYESDPSQLMCLARVSGVEKHGPWRSNGGVSLFVRFAP